MTPDTPDTGPHSQEHGHDHSPSPAHSRTHSMSHHPRAPWWQAFVPKLFTVLQEGYGFKNFRADALAGLTVAIVAIPLAMALGIASGTTPDKGLVTAVIAGFIISALGGSRVQIGGPTGAFVVVVYNIIGTHGYNGLLIATLMAGVMLLIAAAAKLGTWIKYIPQPVITGFTAGIAVIIFSSQIRDFFGLEMDKVPGPFLEKWQSFYDARDSLNPYALGLSALSLGIIILLRRFAPQLPAFLIAVVAGSLLTLGFQLPVVTIGSAFGELPHSLPMPQMPQDITVAHMMMLLPSAFTIAFLAGIESLLSAVVADGMIDRRHRSNCELMGQGVANIASAFFGGLPATGAIARTVTNIRSGGRSPVAGMLHAAFILLAMMFLAPLASYIPLASLSAVLMIVAWNMSEREKIRHLMRAPFGEKLVLIITFVLTVAVDLTFAIEIGVVLAAIIFMHRMAEQTNLIEHEREDLRDEDDSLDHHDEEDLPQDVVAYRLHGPLFFGVGSRLLDAVEQLSPTPKIFILRLSLVPLMDSSGESALRAFLDRCKKKNIFVILCNVQPQPRKILKRMHILPPKDNDYILVENFAEAVTVAKSRLSSV